MALHKVVSLFLITVVLAGCVPPKNQRSAIRVGRGRADVSGNFNASTSYGTNGTDWNKTWGEVTASSNGNTFAQELLNFTSPSLNNLPQDDQLGFVSGQSGQNTGVRFYGNAVTTGGTGGASRSFDQNSMTIHVEIYDDRAGQPRADGTTRPPVVIEISPDVTGFVGAGGTLSGSQVNLYFQDQYGSIRMSGTINGQNFNGNFGYCTGDTSFCSNTNNTRMLGAFTVDACGFFQCN